MAGRLEGKVALISGAARGQGRSHAVSLAQEGADIIAFDICRRLDTVPYPMATPEDLEQTVKLVEDLDCRIMAREADVRDSAAVRALVDEGVAEFGRLDVVCANAGIGGVAENTWSISDQEWEEMIAVDLTGAWKTVKAAVPAMIQAGNGGSIVITSSAAGLKGMTGAAHYVAAKHGLVGLMRTLANELAPHFIRVNTVHPTGVNTPMIVNDFMAQVLSRADGSVNLQNALPVEMIEPLDVSNAIVWLASEEARYVTGVSLPVDAGLLQR
ncbi:mycofactocin-coupled SDR family oxidoreductase [Pseudonocardia alaniniphila]|uniref:Mycofactocin-coupled SDR family oxidoreductase n=1 Tax=Pseudonocardia alaniniphila TaxID=75291 RepID=A0ABS9TR70_9PSEU|nr:mycofactocin-coupled SDR family oxidoreductase [Pseudonocardia alaniniphila]MCH6171026.1 mycofactocin-coupled SDR family oxidoreductase [Pseudonocardia alaniniphila]